MCTHTGWVSPSLNPHLSSIHRTPLSCQRRKMRRKKRRREKYNKKNLRPPRVVLKRVSLNRFAHIDSGSGPLSSRNILRHTPSLTTWSFLLVSIPLLWFQPIMASPPPHMCNAMPEEPMKLLPKSLTLNVATKFCRNVGGALKVLRSPKPNKRLALRLETRIRLPITRVI